MTRTPPHDRVAVVVIDAQNDFCHPDGVFARAGMTVDGIEDVYANINQLVAAARQSDNPVIWVRMEWADDETVGLLASRSKFLATEGLRTGTWGAEIVDALDITPNDHIVPKTRFGAFHDTRLAGLLEELEVGTIVVCGVRTDFCVESTVREAFFRDLPVVVASDAVGGYFPDLHHHSLQLMATVFADVVPTVDAAQRIASASDTGRN